LVSIGTTGIPVTAVDPRAVAPMVCSGVRASQPVSAGSGCLAATTSRSVGNRSILFSPPWQAVAAYAVRPKPVCVSASSFAAAVALSAQRWEALGAVRLAVNEKVQHTVIIQSSRQVSAVAPGWIDRRRAESNALLLCALESVVHFVPSVTHINLRR